MKFHHSRNRKQGRQIGTTQHKRFVSYGADLNLSLTLRTPFMLGTLYAIALIKKVGGYLNE